MSTNKSSKPNELHLSNDELCHSDDELTYFNDSDYENLDNNAWFPTGEMHCLPTKIHKDSLLPKTTRTEILKNQPCNSEIEYEAPSMNKRIWKLMSLQAKETNKLLAKVAYRSSAILRPLNNSLKAIYNMNPDNNNEALMAWEYIETALKDTRSLLLDSLSYTNKLQKQQSLKIISPNYAPPSDRKEVFGKELGSIIEKENTTNKLFDKVADSRAITGYITEHKIRKTGFGVATIIEVTQDHTTQVLQQINKRLYTCGKKAIVLPVRMDTINRIVMAYEHYQKWLPPQIDLTLTTKLLSSKSTLSYFSRNISRDTETSEKMYRLARLIIDLRNLNTYIHPSHFKIETIEIVKALIKQNYYMTSIDIQDAFYHVPLSTLVSCYFAFDVGNYQYQFTALPFGLTSSPRIFTKIMKPVLAWARNPDPNHNSVVRKFRIQNQYTKAQSNTNPTNRISGFQDQCYRNDSKSPNKESQRDKKGMFYNLKEANNICKKVSIIYWKAFSYYWHNIFSKTKNAIPDKRQKLNHKIPWVELSFNTIITKHSTAQLVDQEPGGLEQNMFNPTTTNNNYLHRCFVNRMGCHNEPKHSLQSLDRTSNELTHKCLGIKSTYLNHQGGTISQELSLLAEDIWDICLKRKIKLIAQHLLSIVNLQADEASRCKFEQQDWQLNPEVFNQLSKSSGNRCSGIGLDKRSIMGKPPMDTYFQDTIEDTNRTSHTFPDNSRIEDSPLVPLVNEPINRLSYITPTAPNFVSITDKPTKPTLQPKIADICLERNMDSIHGPLEDIIKFLNDMCDQQKAYNTIASYRSAIRSASRPSDLHRIALNTLQKSKTGISFTIINPKETNISISHEWRCTPDLQEHLFLTTTTPHRPAAVDTISRWIKEILSQTDPDTKVKDVRSLSALLAQDAGADIFMILTLGNWSSYNVYQRFYQKGIKNMLEWNKVSSQILNQAKSQQ
ncbi:39063_t:CDS:2 [Gigaspora margarita]|uniref:39063_t:CDS:1 n=1 Tax=Gigaspora margarita TaxID=4874 RepID=A0ABN7VN31_GIGMA|nr:39063_t:CDS:2 [Gigaspora margarita]